MTRHVPGPGEGALTPTSCPRQRLADRHREPCNPHGETHANDTNARLITVGHSPDPDDAFMFYALAHDKIDTGDLQFRHELQDIETLNRRALRGELEVTAVSIHAYAHLLDKYALLPSGCSMGDRYGPMVVAREPMTIDELKTVEDRRARHADDGVPDAAAAAAGRTSSTTCVPFDQIIGAVAAGKYDAGPDHPRGPAHVPEPGAAPGRRSGRLVAGEDRPAAAAGRQRRPPRPGRRRPCGRSAGCSRRASATRWTTAQDALELRPAVRPRHGRGAGGPASSACTSTTGRSTTARAAGRRCAGCSTRRTGPASSRRRWTVEFVE